MNDNDWEDTTLASRSKAELLAALEKKPASLELIKGTESFRTFMLIGEKFLVGREEGAEIQLQSREVSRRHMQLSRQGDEFVLQDLDSRNGVFLNGVKVHSAVLQDGDTVQIGDLIFLFHTGR